MRLIFLLGLLASAAVAQETPEVTAPLAPTNEVSVHGAPTLGQWKRGQSLTLGFPLITLKAAIGLFDRLDFGLGFETYYFLTFEFLAFIKVGLVRGTSWSFSLAVEGEGSFFTTPAAAETRGARWLTGHRNYSVSPQAILTYAFGVARVGHRVLIRPARWPCRARSPRTPPRS